MKYSTSPQRGSFMRKHYLKMVEVGDMTQEYFDKLQKILSEADVKNNTPKEDNLEWDLRSSEYIVQKCKADQSYSQNLYSAMCNNLFYKGEKEWSCSWRYAGGIVADLNEAGDYIDWYCSGIGSSANDRYVGEGFVTEEVRSDLLKLGWVVKPYPDDQTSI